MYQNVRGLNSKLTSFYNNILALSDEFDIFVLTETWLHNDVSNAELFPDDFAVYRCDRNFERLGNTRGGGVLIGVNNTKLTSTNIDVSNIVETVPSIDLIGVKVKTSYHENLFIFAVLHSALDNFSRLRNIFRICWYYWRNA